jgi:ectoine hydroxylase-related dioxygenase (phytanoyl-CoA dioxygenase family)
MLTKSFQEMIADEGYIYFPRLFRGEELQRLKDACEYILEKFTAEHQAKNPDGDFVSIRHLHDPKWTKDAPHVFRTIMETVADPRILGVVEQAFEGPSLFKETTLWVNPRKRNEQGPWHRDSQFLHRDEQEERKYLEFMKKNNLLRGINIQIALVDNSDLEYVPYSQGRWDAPEENAIRRPKGNSPGERETGEMPHAKRLHLKAGDAAAFSQYGLHRGNYFKDNPRRTLMINYASMAYVFADNNEYKEDLSNHHLLLDQKWCLNEGYLDGLSLRAKAYWQQFIDTFRDKWV